MFSHEDIKRSFNPLLYYYGRVIFEEFNAGRWLDKGCFNPLLYYYGRVIFYDDDDLMYFLRAFQSPFVLLRSGHWSYNELEKSYQDVSIPFCITTVGSLFFAFFSNPINRVSIPFCITTVGS